MDSSMDAISGTNTFYLKISQISYLFHRVVSTQMPPELTVKVMVHETETYNQVQYPWLKYIFFINVISKPPTAPVRCLKELLSDSFVATCLVAEMWFILHLDSNLKTNHFPDPNQNSVYSPSMLHNHRIYCGKKVQTINIYTDLKCLFGLVTFKTFLKCIAKVDAILI